MRQHPRAGRDRTVKLVPATHQPVLDAIGAGSRYKDDRGRAILPTAVVNNLQRSGMITTVFSNGAAHLTDKGHVALAAQRGDREHQDLNEQVAAAERKVAAAAAAVAENTARRGDPLDRDWSRRSFDLQQAQQQAYGQWMTLRHQRTALLQQRAAAAEARVGKLPGP